MTSFSLVVGAASLVAFFVFSSCDCLGCLGLVDDFHHLLLESLAFLEKAVFVPNKIDLAWVEVVALHAALKQTQNVAVVWILSERQSSAIVHKLLELGRLVLTQLINSHLLLLSLDVCVLLVFGASRKSLPRKGSSEEVQKHVSNGLQVVSSRLLVANMSVQRGISGSARQVLALSEWDVLTL